MKINVWCFSLLLLTILSFIHVTQSSSPPSISFLGISPQDEKYFKAEIIKCKNGSKKFTKAQLNDDYCDCPDGTDEPGTSACPQGKFYCRNAGHLPILLFSSRVNDGICDCCDGSDEYDGKVKCPNTCWEAGKLARDKLKKKIEMYQEGITIRKQEVEKAVQAVAKDEVELAKLKNDEKILKVSVKQLKARKEKIEKAEDRERLQREKEEKMKEAATEKYEAENKSEDKEEALNTSDDDKIGLLDDPPSDQHEKDGPESTEGLSREELGRLVASRWTGGKTGLLGEGIDTAKDDHGGNNEIPERIYHNDHDDSAPKQNEANQKNGEDDMEDSIDEKFVGDDLDGSHAPHKPDSEDQKDLSDMKTLSSSSWLGKIKETVRNLLQSANSFPTPVDKLEADRVRKEYDDSSTRLSEVESRISSLTEKLKQNFGVEKEFYSFYDHCYEIKKNTYVYKVCPFKEATQEEGYSKTQLGHWEKFENSYRIMLFSNGHGCWNGPDRSLKVKLRCGLNTELTDVDEPSRCEYVALMSTPAVCVEGKLKELKHKLESMNKQPQSHDEL